MRRQCRTDEGFPRFVAREGLPMPASPSPRSRAVRAPARLRLTEMGPSYLRANCVRIPHSPPKKAVVTRVISTHPDFWDSLRASRSVPRHRLRAGIRLRRTGSAALASSPCPTPAPLSFESPTLRQKKPPFGGSFWRRVGDSNPRKACTFTRFPGVLLKPLGQLSRSWLPLGTGNIEVNTGAGRVQGRVFRETQAGVNGSTVRSESYQVLWLDSGASIGSHLAFVLIDKAPFYFDEGV